MPIFQTSEADLLILWPFAVSLPKAVGSRLPAWATPSWMLSISNLRGMPLGWPQLEAAQRAGVAYRTWRRLETEGQASVEDMVKAAVALRCEEGLSALFPLPAASSLDALLAQQAARPAARPARVRALRSRPGKAPPP